MNFSRKNRVEISSLGSRLLIVPQNHRDIGQQWTFAVQCVWKQYFTYCKTHSIWGFKLSPNHSERVSPLRLSTYLPGFYDFVRIILFYPARGGSAWEGGVVPASLVIQPTMVFFMNGFPQRHRSFVGWLSTPRAMLLSLTELFTSYSWNSFKLWLWVYWSLPPLSLSLWRELQKLKFLHCSDSM